MYHAEQVGPDPVRVDRVLQARRERGHGHVPIAATTETGLLESEKFMIAQTTLTAVPVRAPFTCWRRSLFDLTKLAICRCKPP
jgi:hypothetical protein